MTTKRKNMVVTCIMVIFFLGTWIVCLFNPLEEFSYSERRKLALFPEVSKENILSGEFMSEFDSYSLDQFPLREQFRTLKAISVFSIFGQSDNHGIYVQDGYASKLEYPFQEVSLKRATDRFEYIYDMYIKGTDAKVYFSVIPDKNYFLAKKSGYLSMNYDNFFRVAKENTEYMEYIDITELLSIEDYYKTDTHWRQEKIVDVAKEIAGKMGVELTGEYEENSLANPFYGVYYGQSALPLPAEELKYLTNKTLDECQVYDYQNGKNISVYDMEKAKGKDPYEMFLSGSLSLMTIENPSATSGKELILFRDSFGSSIAPLLIEGYAKVTLVDIRYIPSDLLENYIEFDDQDVLFLYSTLVLNHGDTLK